MWISIYEGKLIYSLDILRVNDTIDSEMDKEFRDASKEGLLKCNGCGNRVIYRFKDLKKRKPHFAHYSTKDNKGCSYGKETDEHIEGKMLLLRRMEELHPNIVSKIGQKVKPTNRFADLHFKLKDEELVIEFQRTDLDFKVLEDKIGDYKSIDLNNIWLLSGNEEDLEKISREHNLSFFQRTNLYNEDKPLLFLDVENKTITMMKKMEYRDKETNKPIMDWIFQKTYPLDDLIINLDGTFESDFEVLYRAEELKFIKDQEKKEEERQRQRQARLIEIKNIETTESYKAPVIDISPLINRNKIADRDIEIDGSKIIEDNTDGNKEEWIKKYKKTEKHINQIRPEKMDIYYKVFENLVADLLNNYTDEKFHIISLACHNNISINQLVEEILNRKIAKGNIEADTMLNKITDFVDQI